MNLVDTILQRRSQPQIDGDIDAAELQAIFQCALTAPDHKRLRPWKFIVCAPEHKALLAETIVASRAWASDEEQSAYRAQVERKLDFAPHIVICALRVNRQTSVPDVEQILSSGASIQNMIIAAESLGYRCYWKTGEWAYNPVLRERLGLDGNTILTGYLGLGRRARPDCPAKPVERPQVRDHFICLDDVLAEAALP